MSTVSRVVKKTIRSPQAQTVGAVAKSKWTWGSLIAGVFAAVGLPMVTDVGKIPKPIAPPGVEQSVPIAPSTPDAPPPPVSPDSTPPAASPTPEPASPVAQPEKSTEAPTVAPEGPCFEKKARKVWKTYTYQQKYVGVGTGNVIYKPASGKKLATVYDEVKVPCSTTKKPPAPVVNKDCDCSKSPDTTQPSPVVPAPEAKPVNPIAPAPSVVQPGTVMYGVRGLGGIGDAAAFRDFATARGYTPVWIDAWDPGDAQEQLNTKVKKTTAPYALYGFSLGAKTVRDFAMASKENPPALVVTVGASSVVAMEGKFSPNTKVEHYFHVGTKHDAPGEFLKAPHTGPGNIQRVIADAAIAAKK